MACRARRLWMARGYPQPTKKKHFTQTTRASSPFDYLRSCWAIAAAFCLCQSYGTHTHPAAEHQAARELVAWSAWEPSEIVRLHPNTPPHFKAICVCVCLFYAVHAFPKNTQHLAYILNNTVRIIYMLRNGCHMCVYV